MPGKGRPFQAGNNANPRGRRGRDPPARTGEEERMNSWAANVMRGAGGQHRARPATARRGRECAPAFARGRQPRRRRLASAALPLLRRPDDHRRDVRRAALLALVVAEPDQDRQLMTVAPRPAAHRRSPPPPAARRNTSATPARGRKSSCDRGQRLAPAHRRHRNSQPSALPLKAPSAADCRRLARQPSAILKSP